MNNDSYRKDFPIFKNNPDLVYLDSSATSLKPQRVVNAVNDYYTRYSANIKRGIYSISEEATAKYEEARGAVAHLIGADPREVIFTKNATEAINLVAYSFGSEFVGENDEVVTTIMEHHSNFVPWQRLASVNGAVFKVIDITADGALSLDDSNIHSVINKKTKIVAITHVSNVLATVNPVKSLIQQIKKINPKTIVIVDGAQAVGHMPVNVYDLGCDFYAFSGHKMLGPTGIGVLWGRAQLLENMEPFLMGGEMIRSVQIDRTDFAEIPEKFEAGTPPIAEAIGLGESVKYIESIGFTKIRDHEKSLAEYALARMKEEFGNGIIILGSPNAAHRSGIIAFTLKNIHSHDIASLLNEDNICIRAGHHCAMPLHDRLGIAASSRISFHIYNTNSDIDNLIKRLQKIQSLFSS